MRFKFKRQFILTSFFFFLCFAFQNCGQGFSIHSIEDLPSSQASSETPPGSSEPPTETKECVVAGVSYKPGSSLVGYALYSVVAPAQCGAKITRTCLSTGQFDGPPVFENCTQLSAQANSVDSLLPGEWMEVPNSMVQDSFPKVSPGGYSSAVIGAWGGGAYDTKRDRMILWGGGHGDYAGNEIYVFDLNTLKWTRVNEPSPVPSGVTEFRTGYYPDGGPVSRHTYNYIQYLPDPVDRFCTFGGAAFWQTGQYGSAHTDCFNFDLNQWETQKFSDATSFGIGANSAYDPVTASVWVSSGYGDMGMSKLDLKTGLWSQLWAPYSGAGYTLGYYRTSDIDPINRKMVAVGQGKVLTWDLTKSGLNYAEEITTSGPQNLVSSSSPGFVYVPELRAFVGWAGGPNLYQLDLASKSWTELPPAAGTKSIPPSVQNATGTFGRLRYSSKKKALVLVNSHNQNVFIYKVK